MLCDLDGEMTVFSCLLLWVVVFHYEKRRHFSVQRHTAFVATLRLVRVDIDARLALVVGSQDAPPTLSPSLHAGQKSKEKLINLRSVFTTKKFARFLQRGGTYNS